MEQQPGGGTPPDWRPVPDPTLLTTEQIKAEIAHLKEVTELRIEALKELWITNHALHTGLIAQQQEILNQYVAHQGLYVKTEDLQPILNAQATNKGRDTVLAVLISAVVSIVCGLLVVWLSHALTR